MGGWLGGNPYEPRMVAEVLQAKRLRVADQLAEDAVTAGQGSDQRPRLRVDPGEDEAFELRLLVIEHAECGVAGAGQLARRLENLAKDRFQIEL